MRITAITFALILHSLCIGQIIAFTFNIQTRDPYCFRVLVEYGSLEVMFSVNGNKPNSVQFSLLNNAGETVLTKIPSNQSPTQHFTHAIPDNGYYQLCFQRNDSDPKTVFINWNIKTSSTNYTPENADHNSIINLEIKFDQLHEMIDKINNFIQVQENDQQEQYRVTKETNRKVLIWSLIKIGIIIAICLFEVYFVTSYFAAKDTIGKRIVRLGMKRGAQDQQSQMTGSKNQMI